MAETIEWCPKCGHELQYLTGGRYCANCHYSKDHESRSGMKLIFEG